MFLVYIFILMQSNKSLDLVKKARQAFCPYHPEQNICFLNLDKGTPLKDRAICANFCDIGEYDVQLAKVEKLLLDNWARDDSLIEEKLAIFNDLFQELTNHFEKIKQEFNDRVAEIRKTRPLPNLVQQFSDASIISLEELQKLAEQISLNVTKEGRDWRITQYQYMSKDDKEFFNQKLEQLHSITKQLGISQKPNTSHQSFEQTTTDSLTSENPRRSFRVRTHPIYLEGHSDWVYCVDISPDSTMVASGSYNGEIRLWDVQSRFLVKEYYRNESMVYTLSFSGNGKYLASAGVDMRISLWNLSDLQKEEPIIELPGHEDCINRVTFSHDSKFLVSGSDDKTVRVWDVEKRLLIHTFQASNWAIGVGISRSNLYVAGNCADGVVNLWNLAKKSLVAKWKADSKQYGTSVDFSADDKLMVTSGQDKIIKIWEINSVLFNPNVRPLRSFFGHQGKDCSIWTVVFSPDQRFLASACSGDNRVKVWDVSTGNELQDIPILGGMKFGSVQFAPDMKFIATGGMDYNVRIYLRDL